MASWRSSSISARRRSWAGAPPSISTKANFTTAPPPDLPYGQFRVLFLKVKNNGTPAGWASGYAYSPNLRRMISLAWLDRGIASGAEVQVLWGGFSDEPSALLRAKVVELPFLARNREKDLNGSEKTIG